MVSLDKDAAIGLGRDVATFVPDLVTMLRRVAADPRVPQASKLEAAGALAYLVSPRNRLTNFIPVVGQLDDIAIVAFAFRRIVVGAGEPILREHWRGSDRSFNALLGASSALATPRGMFRKVALVRTIAVTARDKVSSSRRGPGAAPGVRIIDGEVVRAQDPFTPTVQTPTPHRSSPPER